MAGGFVQLNQGKRAPVRLKSGDMLAMYSPHESIQTVPLQAFTAIGTVRTGEVYQVQISPGLQVLPGAAAKRAFEAMMDMKKIDIAAIEAARRG